MRKILGRMQAGKHLEKITVLRRRIRNARVTKEQREDRPERRPQNHQGEKSGNPGAVDFFHEQRDHRGRRVCGRDELAPRDNPDDGEIDGDVDQRHPENANEDGAGDDPAGIFDFVPDKADVVIAEVIVNADPCGRAQTKQEAERKFEALGRKVEGQPGIEMQRAGDDHRARGEQSPNPQAHRDLADGGNPPVEQRDAENAQTHDHSRTGRRKSVFGRDTGPQVVEILRKADVTRGDLQRPAQDELPDEQKRHQSSEGFAAKTVAQIDVTAARARHGRAQLAPDQRVRHRDEDGHQPADHRLGPVERRHEGGNRDERPDADHVGHVQRRGLQQAEPAEQVRMLLGSRCGRVVHGMWRCPYSVFAPDANVNRNAAVSKTSRSASDLNPQDKSPCAIFCGTTAPGARHTVAVRYKSAACLKPQR